MTEPARAQGIRVGTAERDAATAALAEHLQAGRLDADEYAERAAKAAAARFGSDLDVLFADLPPLTPTGTAAAPPVAVPSPPAAAAPSPAAPSPAAPSPAPTLSSAPPAPHIGLSGREAFGGRKGATLVALSPFVALALFFGLAAMGFGASWLAFLLVPIAGVVVYGSGGSHRSR